MLKTTGTFKGIGVYDRRFWDIQNHMAGICATLEGGRFGGGGLVEAPSKEVVIMRLTNNLGGGEYEFTEMEPGVNGSWAVKAGGATYANGQRARSGRCHEANLNARVRVPSVQIGTVKYSANGTPFYRFENCCVSAQSSGSGSGSGSDDPTTTDDGIAERTFLVNWQCVEYNNCKFPMLVRNTLRFEVGMEIARLIRVSVEILWECGWLPCPHSGPSGSGGSTTQYWDVWRPCSTSDGLEYPQPGDRVFPLAYLAAASAEHADPVFQENGTGICYKFSGFSVQGTAAEVGAEFPDGEFRDSCDDDNCENCVCEETCVRITDETTGDYIELGVAEEGAACEDGFTVEVNADGLENGGGLFWNNTTNQWVLYVLGGDGGAWQGTYAGGSIGCPSGTFVLIETLAGSPPSTVTVSACAPPAECPETAPARLRIADYSRTYFGDVKIYTNACNDPNSTSVAPEWDGTMANLLGPCSWSNGGSWTYEDGDGVDKWIISSQVTLVPGDKWALVVQFTRNTNLSGTPTPAGYVRYKKAEGASPAGTYVRDPGADVGNFDQVGCYQIRDTIVVEEY